MKQKTPKNIHSPQTKPIAKSAALPNVDGGKTVVSSNGAQGQSADTNIFPEEVYGHYINGRKFNRAHSQKRIKVQASAKVFSDTQNQKIKKGETSENINSNLTPTSTPTPSFSPDQVKIKNGSVVREIPGGETTILVDKENYDSTGITGFAKVVVSPDETKICFESWPPAPEHALYSIGLYITMSSFFVWHFLQSLIFSSFFFSIIRICAMFHFFNK